MEQSFSLRFISANSQDGTASLLPNLFLISSKPKFFSKRFLWFYFSVSSLNCCSSRGSKLLTLTRRNKSRSKLKLYYCTWGVGILFYYVKFYLLIHRQSGLRTEGDWAIGWNGWSLSKSPWACFEVHLISNIPRSSNINAKPQPCVLVESTLTFIDWMSASPRLSLYKNARQMSGLYYLSLSWTLLNATTPLSYRPLLCLRDF